MSDIQTPSLPISALLVFPWLRRSFPFLLHVRIANEFTLFPANSNIFKYFQQFVPIDTVKSLLEIYEAHTHSFLNYKLLCSTREKIEIAVHPGIESKIAVWERRFL